MSPRSASTRTDILRAARGLIETAQFAEVTLTRVAAAAGVSRQAIYLHFGSKTQLLVALVGWIDGQGRLPELTAEARRGTDPVDMALRGVRAAATYNLDIADVGLALRAARHSDPAAAAAWEDRMAGRLAGIRSAVQLVEAAGRLRPQWTTQTATDAIFALTSLTVYEDLVRDRGWPPDRYVDQLACIARHTFITPDDDKNPRASTQ
jgi:AcrR family transcriptional regulator